MYIYLSKEGRGEEDGIYLLAKDLAYNVALDQTSKLAEGIQKLTKKDMHEVSKAINVLDPSEGIDKKICNGKYQGGNADTNVVDAAGKCEGYYGSSHSSDTSKYKGFRYMFEKPSDGSSGVQPLYMKEGEKGKKMQPHASETISKDVSALTKDQKGIVSSAFAKAHEGANSMGELY